MRRITPADVNSMRTLIAWVVRAVALLLLAIGAYLLLKKVLFGFGSGNEPLETIFQVWEDTGEAHSTYRGLAMLIVGLVLALGARRFARWIVSPPEEGCPRCGYTGAVTDTCPECGQTGMPQH